MARPVRVEIAGGLYHVIVRGNERKSVFRDDADREWYLARLGSYRERFGFRLLAYYRGIAWEARGARTNSPPIHA